MDKIRLAYVNSDDLYVWVKDNFDSFDKWLVFEAKNIELLKGNASAVGQLKSLLGLNRSVGRPKGTGNHDEEYQLAIEQRLQDEYKVDVARLSSN